MTGSLLTPAPSTGPVPSVPAAPSTRARPAGQGGAGIGTPPRPVATPRVDPLGRVPWVGIVVFALGAAVAALVALPFATPLSEAATQWIHGTGGSTVDRFGDAGVALLGLLAALTLAGAWRGRSPGNRRWAAAAAALAAAPVVYLVASWLKQLVREVRPCTALGLPGQCPPVDDYSWPSNHTAVAAALTIAVVLASPRLWARLSAGFFLVLVIATRIASGAHWVHDVACGAALGALACFLVLAVAHAATGWVRGRAGAEDGGADGPAHDSALS